MIRKPKTEDFERFCAETGRLNWHEYRNIPVTLAFAEWCIKADRAIRRDWKPRTHFKHGDFI